MIRVIVADDEYFARKVLVKMVKELSVEAEICGEAETGLEVLEIMESQPVDIVITDIRMPDMDGLELSREISERFFEASVIIESGYADFDYATTAIRYGVKDYLTKPVNAEELEKAILRVIEEKQKERQSLEEKLAVRRGQFMDFSRILESETVSCQMLTEGFAVMDRGEWCLAAVQSDSREITEEQVRKVLDILGNSDGETKVWCSYFYPKGEFILFLNPGKGRNEVSETFFRRKLLECQKKAEVNLSIGLSRIHGRTQNSKKEVSAAYREAVYAVNQRLLQPGKQVYRYEPEVNVLQLFTPAEERNLEHCLTEHRTGVSLRRVPICCSLLRRIYMLSAPWKN